MKTTKLVVMGTVLVMGMTSSVFASWWNPTTWKVFTRKSSPATQNVVVATTSENLLLSCNGSKYNKCSEGQNFICPTTGEDGFCEIKKAEDIKTPIVKVLSSETPQLKKEAVVTAVKKETVSVSPKKPVAQLTTKTCLNGVTILVSESCKKICPDGEVVVENVACKTNIPTTITQAPQQNKTTTSQDLNKAANNKAEIVNLLASNVASRQKLLDDSTSEIARFDRILTQLNSYTGGTILSTAKEYTIANRNVQLTFQNNDRANLETAKSVKINMENKDISAFLDGNYVSESRKIINESITVNSNSSHERLLKKYEYDDLMRQTIPSLNLNP